ncbi:ORF6N domain-containing protein, partial [Chromatium okenii]|uniref:ORF6N domain-containing protein n=1 Tax=Chromatium okenii TaxID=61644 RepID=UPI001908DA49
MKRASHSAVTVETLPVITFQGVRVLTTDILAQVYGAAPINIQQNYANNKDRFESEKHFFLLVGDDLREFKQLHRLDKKGSVKISPQVKALTLWTERGAARHAKMLETDQAWDVFEKLEDAYFRPLSINPHPMKQPTSAAIPTDLPAALRAYAAEIESHHDDSSMIEML